MKEKAAALTDRGFSEGLLQKALDVLVFSHDDERFIRLEQMIRLGERFQLISEMCIRDRSGSGRYLSASIASPPVAILLPFTTIMPSKSTAFFRRHNRETA